MDDELIDIQNKLKCILKDETIDTEKILTLSKELDEKINEFILNLNSTL